MDFAEACAPFENERVLKVLGQVCQDQGAVVILLDKAALNPLRVSVNVRDSRKR